MISGGQTYQLQPETTQRRKNDTVPKDLISTRRIQRSVSESNSTQPPLPKAVILKTMLVYDKSLLEDFGNDTQKVKNHLYTLAELVKPVLTLLDIKVKLRLFGNGVWGWDDRFYPSDSSFQKIRKKLKGKRIPILLSFFTAQRGRVILICSNHYKNYKNKQSSKGRFHLRFSGIRPLRGYPPPPLNGKSVWKKEGFFP